MRARAWLVVAGAAAWCAAPGSSAAPAAPAVPAVPAAPAHAGAGADAIIDAEQDRDAAMSRAGRVREARVEPRAQNWSAPLDRLAGVLLGESERDESLARVGPRAPAPAAASSAYVELVALGNATGRANLTGHELDDDVAPDTWFTDLQTLVLAGAATLLPLLLVLLVALAVRRGVRRCRRAPPASSGSPCSDKSQLARQKHQDSRTRAKSATHAALLSCYEPMSSPAQEATRASSGGGAGAEGDERAAPPAANGSIITVTLKNNHLIVETEERNDMTRSGRETRVTYSPESDGVFVVEVQQAGSPPPGSPPPRALPRDSTASTGLSVSDLSAGSDAPSYAYGSQLSYEPAPRGYAEYAGYEVPALPRDASREPLPPLPAADPDRPVVTAAILKQDSLCGAAPPAGYCLEGSSDGPLLSDVQAREASLHQLHDRREAQLRGEGARGGGDAPAVTVIEEESAWRPSAEDTTS